MEIHNYFDYFDSLFDENADPVDQSLVVAKPRVSSVSRESVEILMRFTVDAMVAKLESITWQKEPDMEKRYNQFIECWFECFVKMRAPLPMAHRINVLQAFIKVAQSFANEEYLHAWRLIIPQFNQLDEVERSILRTAMHRLAAKREL